ncbi:MAG TPA: protoporphyrinogen oxidase, partial [Candidatus Thermoplasmatota archaeon]|nr:protoporphyrinogen oxidase [Candidatus Thermoplasmatota archaeon]
TSPALPFSARVRLLREPFVKPHAGGEESVAAFAQRRLGSGVLDLADAMVTGVFAGDPNTLSVDHAFPFLRKLEQEHGSLLKGLRAAPRGPDGPARLQGFRRGMGSLPEALSAKVQPTLNTRVTAVLPRLGGGHLIKTSEGDLEARSVVLALSPAEAGRLLDAPFPPQRLARITVVALGFPAAQVRRDIGFGYLAPRSEGRFLLGAVAESNLFPERAPSGHVLLRCLVGGVRDAERASLPDGELVTKALADLRGLGIIEGDPVFTKVVRHANGIPQIEVGHGALLDAAARVEATHPGLFLTGAGYRSVAVNGLIAEAYGTAERVAAFLEQ